MKLRDFIFWIHLSAGVSVGIVILIMAITGTMLAFRTQILTALDKNLLTVTTSSLEGGHVSLNTIMAKAKEASPDQTARAITVKHEPSSSIVVNFGREGTVYVNPYTAEVLGRDSKAAEFLEKVEVWHRWLGMEGKLKPVGHSIKGVCNILFLIMIITGFYLWWPKSWSWPGIKNIILFNPSAKGKARDWNWHNVIGFWGAPFLIIISLTGVIMSYTWASNLLYTMTGNEPPPAQQEQRPVMKSDKSQREQGQSKANTLELDKFFARASEQVKDWESINIRLPQKFDGPVVVWIQEKTTLGPIKRSQLTLDSTTAEVKKWEPASQQNAGRKLRTWARYLHTGEAGGIVGQTMAFLAACGAVVLVWTGIAMAANRFKSWRKKIKVQGRI